MNVDDLFADYLAATVDATWRCCEDLLARATRAAPVDEGTLRASGTITIQVGDAKYTSKTAAVAAARSAAGRGVDVGVVGEVAFNTPYAARQHEEVHWRHPKGGGAKYLERPLGANAARYKDLIGLAAEHALRSDP